MEDPNCSALLTLWYIVLTKLLGPALKEEP